MSTARAVYDGVGGGGDLFEDIKFLVLQRIPERTRWIGIIKVCFTSGLFVSHTDATKGQWRRDRQNRSPSKHGYWRPCAEGSAPRFDILEMA